MFNGIKRFIREARIKADFPHYEKLQYQAYVAASERQFDASQLVREVAKSKDTARRAANAKFEKETYALNHEIAILAQEICRIQNVLRIFQRNYTEELGELYAQKALLLENKSYLIEEMRHLQRERSDEQRSLDDAYGRLESARDSIDSWYGKSERTPWLLGNGGKKLPKHSIFGQSFGDLDEHKRKRGNAISDINDCKEEVNRIKERQRDNKERREKNKAALNQVFEQIAATKAARAQMFELRQQGIKLSVIENELSQSEAYHADRKRRIDVLRTQYAAFIETLEWQLGVKGRQAEIAALEARKAAFLEEFHAFGSQDRRRADHRKKWMSEHGVSYDKYHS